MKNLMKEIQRMVRGVETRVYGVTLSALHEEFPGPDSARTPENPDFPIDWPAVDEAAKRYGLKYEADKRLPGFFNFRWDPRKD